MKASFHRHLRNRRNRDLISENLVIFWCGSKGECGRCLAESAVWDSFLMIANRRRLIEMRWPSAQLRPPHRVAYAKPFVQKYDIKLDYTVRFREPLIEDGVLVLTLRQMLNASRGPRGKQGKRR